MLRADVLQAHIVPRAVHDVLGEATAAGCSTGASSTYGWALHRQTLLLWRVEDGLQAAVRRLQLPEPPAGRTWVQLVHHGSSPALTVVAATGAGQLYVWLDAQFPAAPYSARLFTPAAGGATPDDGVVTALAAAAADAAAPSSLGFLAVLATSDGGLHAYHGSAAGVFPRAFHRPGRTATKPGVFGALGSAVRALYSEAFDPLAHVQRSGPSAMAAAQLQLAPLDGGRWRLLVLTPEALDCWLLGAVAGPHSGEVLQWSANLHGLLAHALGARGELTLLAFAACDSQRQVVTPAGVPAAAKVSSSGGAQQQLQQQQQQHIYVWSAQPGSHSLKPEHAVCCLAMGEGGGVPRLLRVGRVSAAAASAFPEPQPGGGGSSAGWQLAPHVRLSSCLLLTPNGALLEWLPASGGEPRALGASSDNLAATCSSEGAWQLLNSAYGVLEFAASDPEAAEQQAAAAVPGGLQRASAMELLAKTVELMHKEYAAGGPYRDLAAGLWERLARLGADCADGRALLLDVSSGVVDRLPKAGSAGASSGSVRGLLGDKAVRHDLLLAAYQAGSVLGQLAPSEARCVFQHAEQLAAVAAVLEWQRASEAAAHAAGDASGVTTVQMGAAAAAIDAAGAAAAAGGDVAGQQWELCFSRPTASVPALFSAVASQAAAIRRHLGGDEGSATALNAMQQLLGLCGLLQAVASGAQAKASELAAHMQEEALHQAAVGPSWLSGEAPRAAWAEVAEACLQLHSRVQEPGQRMQLALRGHLPALQALLAAQQDALRTSAPGPATAALQETYAAAALQHGKLLLQDAAEELEAMGAAGLLSEAAAAVAAGDAATAAGEEAVGVVQRALVWPLEALAQQHHCHELLYDTCELLLTTGLLDGQRVLMHMQSEVEAAGGALPANSFTFYVMERWRTSGQLSLLLRLGRQGFQPQLQSFLAAHPSLLWMSQVQAGMLAKAATTLADAADAEKASAAKCRRLLCLTKLAAHAAAGDAGPAQAAASARLDAQASARLRQLALQQALQPGSTGAAPMTAAQLALAALGAAEASAGPDGAAAAVAAVEALALSPDVVQSQHNRQLWERSWLLVLQHTPLGDMAAERGASLSGSGAAADAFEAAVHDSPLFQAFLRAAAALADARQQAPAAVSPADLLDGVAQSLLAAVEQQQPAAVGCMQALLHEASEAAFPLLSAA